LILVYSRIAARNPYRHCKRHDVRWRGRRPPRLERIYAVLRRSCQRNVCCSGPGARCGRTAADRRSLYPGRTRRSQANPGRRSAWARSASLPRPRLGTLRSSRRRFVSSSAAASAQCQRTGRNSG